MRTLFASALLLCSFSAFAGSYSGGTWSSGTTDDAYWDVYGDAIDNYAGSAGNLSACISGTLAYKNYMQYIGYSNYLIYTDSSAWPSDYEESKSDDYYHDNGDYNYFSGHGFSGGIFFGTNSTGDLWVTGAETNFGEVDAEVSAFDSCQTLDAAGRTAFGNASLNDGVHYLLGFQSNALDVTTTANNYGMYLYYGYNVRTAWVYATMDGHDSAYTAAYVRFTSASCNTYNDTATTVSCDPRSGSYYMTSTWSL